MKALHLGICITVLGVAPAVALAQPQHFEGSLHATRAGKNFWYGAENGGFETFTGVPIEELGCVECHGPADANGDPYEEPYSASCTDCHQMFPGGPVVQDQCYTCHGRQKTERFTLGLTDVHRDAGMVCWDCHGTGDLHGTGTDYDSMFEPGAVSADCVDCHNDLPVEHANYDPHDGAIHCASCHTQTVISCYNCHFESQVIAHVKRAKQPLSGFVMLVNREEDGKVYPATFQSLTYEGDSFAAFGLFTGHSISAEGRGCQDCHVNFGGSVPAIDEYNATGQICFAQWDDDAGVLNWTRGIIPIPEDYQQTLKMDFITYDGEPDDPPGPSTNWSSIGEYTWDGSQMFFATPMTRGQMNALGFVDRCAGDLDGNSVVDMADIIDLLLAWGPCEECCPGDYDDSRAIDMGDINVIFAAWGDCF